MTPPILEVNGLVKRYGALTAVNDIHFSIVEGQVLGLLGPNGAGKSTTIAMLTGLFPPDSGAIRIMGFDAVEEPDKVKQLIGIVPQDLALYPGLSGRENVRFFGEMYGLGGKRLNERVDSVLAVVAMNERAGELVRTYSGGMKRRINLAVGLVNNPRVLLLDEPTLGIDLPDRNHTYESVEQLSREQGMAILYATQSYEDAERLCHRVAIIDHGRIIALDTPGNLITMLGGGIIQIGLGQADETICQKVNQLSEVRRAGFLAPEHGETEQPADGHATLKVEALRASEGLIQILQLLNQENVQILSIETLAPNLESVFRHLTGRLLRQ